MTEMTPFHLAFVVDDIEQAESFYAGVLGCSLGRKHKRWIDFNLRGHQITAHLADSKGVEASNPVDGDQVPVPHFGLILPWDEWEEMAERIRQSRFSFLIEPRIRFQDQPGEQGTFFVRDPAGNALEFKSFRDSEKTFARN
ncbi:MAG: VOC family protein [Proteobacteria bacterium]|nr:VOC family protein [Pseudomonadota bacterium]